jgi:hypothetical protein
MKTQLPPESLESRIAPAAVSGLGDELVGPLDAALADQSLRDAAPPILEPSDALVIPRSGNVDLGLLVSHIATVPVNNPGLTNLPGAAAEAVQGVAATLGVLATSALGGEPTGVGTVGIGDGDGAPAGIDTTSALESNATSIADLVLVKTGGFAGANPESLLIVKV